MTEKLSVIIPTLNEAHHLPLLLEALNQQTRQPDEILIADAGSSDETVFLAQAAGARVVAGGMPAVGRNSGARAASGDLLLFLDADVLPGREFIAALLEEFEAKNLEVATSLMEPLGDRASDWMLCDICNLYLQLMQYVQPHAVGFCILVKRAIHEAIEGFDESLVMCEDHHYVQTAAKRGEDGIGHRFGVLTSTRIPVSMRRLEKEGLIRLALKYLYTELFALSGKPVRSIPFTYEFGKFEGEGRELEGDGRGQVWKRVQTTWAIRGGGKFVWFSMRGQNTHGWLRQQLRWTENPLNALSERGRAALRALGSLQLSTDAFEKRVQAFLPSDLKILRRYARRQLASIHLNTGPLRDTWEQIRDVRHWDDIWLVDMDWHGLFRSGRADLDDETDPRDANTRENEEERE